MKPMADTESPSTFWLSWLTRMNHTTETAPMTMVDTVGVWKRELTRPNGSGIARQRAIDSVVRAVGRIVVCVDAEAELRTARIRILSRGEGKTLPPRALSTSSEWSVRNFGPP